MLFRPDPGVARVLFEGHFLLVETLGLAGLVRFTAAAAVGSVSAPLLRFFDRVLLQWPGFGKEGLAPG